MTKRQAYASKLAFSIVSIDQGTTHPGRFLLLGLFPLRRSNESVHKCKTPGVKPGVGDLFWNRC